MCPIAETRRIPITSPLGRNCGGNDNKKSSGNGNDKRMSNLGHDVCVFHVRAVSQPRYLRICAAYVLNDN